MHPFEVSQATDDVRITTRFDESFISMAIFGAENTSFCAIYIKQRSFYQDRLVTNTPAACPLLRSSPALAGVCPKPVLVNRSSCFHPRQKERTKVLCALPAGTLHESGHGMYEQNVDPVYGRTALTTDLPGTRKRRFYTMFALNTERLPRQARDKHRKR